MNLLLGTMTFGEQLFEEDVKSIIYSFLDYGYNELDTAYVYNDGLSEQFIGTAIKELDRHKIKIDSKVNPRITGRLDRAAVEKQLEESLIRLKTDYLDVYYLHFPDANSPIEPVLESIDTFYKNGKLCELGLSNFPAEMVRQINDICLDNAWIRPTVYEGLYNPLSRKVEGTLEKCLHELNIRLNVYNPLAGGLLTNKYASFSDIPTNGRFTFRPNYKNRYWKESYFNARDMIRNQCSEYNIDITEATMRWLSNSSILDSERDDGIIIGVSKLKQLKDNIKFAQSGILPEKVIKSFDAAWKLCKDDSPEYFRFYGR